MKTYELSYLVSSDLSDSEVGEIRQRVKDALSDIQGAIDKTEDFPKRPQGVLSSVIFFLDSEKLPNLTAKLKTEKKLINFMIVNKKPQKAVQEPRRRPLSITGQDIIKTKEPSKKVEIQEIEKKLEEILGE